MKQEAAEASHLLSKEPLNGAQESSRQQFQTSWQTICDKPSAQSAENESEGISSLQFFGTMFKICLGIGVLSLPKSMAYSGLVGGSITMVFIAAMTCVCFHFLVMCVQRLREEPTLRDTYLDYRSVVANCFAYGPSWAHSLKWPAVAFNVCFFLQQLGLGLVYILFTAKSIKQVTDHFTDHNVTIIAYLTGVTVAATPLTFITSIESLSVINSACGFISVGVLLGILIYSGQFISNIQYAPLIKSIDQIPLSLGIIAFCYEAVSCLLPAENAMRDKSVVCKWYGPLNLAFVATTTLYLVIAIIGYGSFGDNVHESIMFDLPVMPWYYLTIKLLFAITILFGNFATQFFVLHEILWLSWKNNFPDRFAKVWIKHLLRILPMVLIFLIDAVVPLIFELIDLSGSTTAFIACYLFPVICHTILFWESFSRTRSYVAVATCIFVFILGVIAAISSWILTIRKIAALYHSH